MAPQSTMTLSSLFIIIALITIQPCLSYEYKQMRPSLLSNGTIRWRNVNRRVLSTSSSRPGLRAEMSHRHSAEAQILTRSERISRMVGRSNFRAKRLASHMSNKATDLQAPVWIGNGEYVMSLNIGTPAKSYTVIVDTGSDLTWIQCSPCSNCFTQPSPMFDPSKSSSYKALGCSNNLCQSLPVVEACSPSCQYFYEYGDQSTTVGIFSTEALTMSNTAGSKQQVGNLAFGCGHDNQGSFSGVDGLVGLGQGPVSFSSQLNSLISGKFSYCLVGIVSSPTETSPLLFGSAAVPSGNVVYTPIVQNQHHPTYYYVGLTGISVGGTRLNIPASVFAIDASGAGGTILDSGTTITQLVSPAYRVLVRAFQTAVHYPQVSGTSSGLDLCFDVSGARSNANDGSISVPSLTFHFDGADVDLPGENYFVAVDEQGTLCLAMAGFNGFTIFGNIQQQNYQVVYDRAAGRVGFMQKQCDSM